MSGREPSLDIGWRMWMMRAIRRDTAEGGMTMALSGKDTLKCRQTLSVGGKSYDYFSLPEAAKTLGDVSRLPFSLKVLLENLLRHEDGGHTVSVDHIKALAAWVKTKKSDAEIAYRPARV